ncbi:dihydrofolate reductase [Hyphomicrobium methylovorum]|uniref:dihydrofolate reductase family protein n=1 Tax=Hyphomicrobium methylovorum TaxID=84 RepID=UPI0015E7395B|nr:dihydrofolate reductase family protein [Hyphomicrobium methylovorum]MBA2126581.1 dihydrofolate reductase [Hyphomicrobium methylovorum]
MRELILKMFVSLDGFVGSADGNPGVLQPPPDPVAKAWNAERVSETSLHVVGSNTFRMWAGYWPSATDAFAAPMNRIPKAVFSKRGAAILDEARAALSKLETVQPGAESWSQAYVASGDLVDEVAKLKAQDGKPMFAYGGASFARSLIAHNLVDQFELATVPIVLGQGLPIFTEVIQPRRFTLISSKAFPAGTIVNCYRPS